MLQTENCSAPFTFRNDDGQRLRIQFFSDSIARITTTQGRDFLDKPSRIVIAQPQEVFFKLREDPDAITVSTQSLTIRINKITGALIYLDSTGKLLVREPEPGGRSLLPKPITRNIFPQHTSIALEQSIDGARASATNYETIFDRNAFEATLELILSDDEAIFGLGSHEEGYGNLRGRSRDLYQQNMKAVVPHLVSTRGYSILLDCSALMTFHDDAPGAVWWADAVDELDFYFIHGGDFAGVMRGYRHLTGVAPLPPKWAFGYVQSKERYVTADEMISIVAEYRRRKIPLDCIVLDWKSWPNGAGWGQKSFDPARFPDPSAFTAKLHELNAKLMVSIWPIMTGGCPNQRELLDHHLMLGNNSTYNAFSPEARALYWQQANRGLFVHSIDAWWCDCTEPFEADWSGATKPSPAERLRINTEASKLYIDAADINAYSLVHSEGIYKGQRSVTSEKRVLNLTRSSYAGQHRYATVTWNGDICATWETLRACIPEGLNFCATGEAYWTVDAGGFFVGNDPNLWFWRGDYPSGARGLTAMDALVPDPADTGSTDLGFFELYTRWLQYAAFLPMFRSHGTDVPREIWRFGEQGTPFYDAIADCIRLRYRLLPYIYSRAAAITAEGLPMNRALALEFPHDHATHNITDQFLFGPSLLVCPITQPMYYGPNSRQLHNIPKSRSVYLPHEARWFNFWTNELHDGGQTITADAPLATIPLFVRAGSILPMTDAMQFVDELPNAPYDLCIYPGADARFTLYEDAGDGYGYERGELSRIHIAWNDRTRALTVHAREGSFAGMPPKRDLRIELVSSAPIQRTLHYTGAELRLRFDGANL
ncbi:MAG TPA: glycoside hydrolase family 31 protein [Candidatus Aquilonibacter sp.]|nr:glycoside hydrolase family 31 protein [Candidatus Aquilonibacter sp.]